MRTISNSDLIWKVYKVHHIGDTYVKAKILFFYKNSKDICYFLNPGGRPKGFKILKSVYKHWETYELNG
jgi:hypothetical protein